MPTTGTTATPQSELLAEFRRQADAPVLPLIELRLDAPSKPRAPSPAHGEPAR